MLRSIQYFTPVKVKTVLFTNSGGQDLAINAIKSLLSAKITQISLACDSMKTLRLISSQLHSTIEYCLWDKCDNATAVNEHFSYGTSGFINLMKVKIAVCLSHLRAGSPIFYIDTDVFVLRNYLEYLNQIPAGISICFQPDRVDIAPYQDLCAGVFFARPTKFAICLLQDIYDSLDYCLNNIDSNKLSKLLPAGDQSILNALVRRSKDSYFADIGTFPAHLFVNGQGIGFLNHQVAPPYLFHNNYIVGSSKKIDKFKQLNMWFTN